MNSFVKKNIVAIIPARGGSKGIKRKNLVTINNKPLIAYSIEQALASKSVNRVVVSTDDEEIKRVALAYKAEAPFLRPKELAEDHVLDLPVFVHALKFFEEKEGYRPEIVVHLRPTAPYRKSEWIDQAITLLLEHPEADSVRSVSAPKQHPYRIFRIDDKGYLIPVMKNEHPTPYLLRRQDLPDMYYYNCVIDVTRPKTIFSGNSMTGNNMLPYIMNQEDVLDIDSLNDLEFAKFMMGSKK